MNVDACLYADTAAQLFEHFGFTIEESTNGWEWTHKDYDLNGVSGTCDTVFEAIAAVNDWRASYALERGKVVAR